MPFYKIFVVLAMHDARCTMNGFFKELKASRGVAAGPCYADHISGPGTLAQKKVLLFNFADHGRIYY